MYKIQTLNKISDCVYTELPAPGYQIAAEEAAPDAVLVRSASMHDVPVPESLLAVARAGAGVNNIPVAEYTKKGIAVFNTPGANANAVAELVVAGMLLSARKVVQGIEWAQGLKGQTGVAKLVEKGKGQFGGPELRGKTLGVIGLGAIGALVANAASDGLGMRVIGVDPFLSVRQAWSLSRAVESADSVAALLPQCDWVSVHVPLNDQTKNMFNDKLFVQMKPGARLLNFSRAELVCPEALKKALESGQLSAYVTDFPTEAVLEIPGVLSIPHLGASTPESEENCAQMAAAQLRAYLETGAIHNSVNLPELALGRAEGYRVQILHENAPALVPQITALIAEKGLSIAGMVSQSRGEAAVTVLDLAETPDESLLAALSALPQVMRARRVGA
ncbi:MAG: 3-phosphoglycerate dehydrogenase [Oscillospiraceae bacterium]|jgi:D-3-phosphoglycerate dehydrogenase|nr:3-phosphoglycerate dehydrogenase [Oscillospiraceae bacterium]